MQYLKNSGSKPSKANYNVSGHSFLFGTNFQFDGSQSCFDGVFVSSNLKAVASATLHMPFLLLHLHLHHLPPPTPPGRVPNPCSGVDLTGDGVRRDFHWWGVSVGARVFLPCPFHCSFSCRRRRATSSSSITTSSSCRTADGRW